MPAIVTHHLFGEEVFARLSPSIGEAPIVRAAFLLGNHGPDPLFFLRALPDRRVWKLGSLMHNKRPSELLWAVHGRFAGGVLRAYGLGFLCHYLLDSSVHPLVFAQQAAYCDAGVDGLTRAGSWHAVHSLMEADLDEYVLFAKRGLTVREFVPHVEVLRCDERSLAAISAAYADVLQSVYGRRVASGTFQAGVHLYRAAQVLLDGRRGFLGASVDLARLSGKHFLTIDAMTHSGTARSSTPYANDDHVPFARFHAEGQVVAESFDELYARAFERALELVPRFAAGDVSLQDCRDITQGLNFSGNAVETA